MNHRLINFFNSALTTEKHVDPIKLNIEAIKVGYIVHPDCCTESVQEFIKAEEKNINSTFYKNWQEIKESDRESLFIDQIIHYASTYGTDFEGETYTKNPDPIQIDYNTYKVIKPISEEDLWNKCYDLICSGIALNSQTVRDLCEYIIYKEKDNNTFNIDNVKNREAIVILCDNLKVYPSDPISLLRYIVYKSTNKMDLIKNEINILHIQCNNQLFNWNTLTDDQLKSLSTIFYRFKPIFLACKNDINKHIINKIRRYAKKYHIPISKKILENVTSNIYSKEEIIEAAKSANNFKIIQILQAIRERIYIWQFGGKDMYIIRNGGIYIKEKEHDKSFAQYLGMVYDLFYNQLITNLKEKACVVQFPKNLILRCPVSEKKFIGNIPYGSYYIMDKHNFIGIYWKDEWGAMDFDLSLIGEDNEKYGWNANYFNKNHEVIYSGDMTNADPEATEILYCSNKCPNGVIKVNRYFGAPNAKFKIFFGSQEISNLHKNYMVDPNCVKLEEMMVSDKSEQMIGYIIDNNIYFMNFNLQESLVSDKNEFADIMKRRSKTYIDLKNVLLDAGFKEFDSEIHDKIDLDLNNLQKDTLINLFS